MKTPSSSAVLKRPLPGVLASAIATIRWPLDAASHPPLHLKPLAELPIAAGRLDPAHSLSTQRLTGTLQELFPDSDDGCDSEERAFGIISTALVLLGHGMPDEAHSLITPYSWPDDIHFNHGPVRYGQSSAAVRSYASYAHSFVHRHEAYHVGEFGMQGWQNANYWSNAAAAGPNELPHADLFHCVSKVVDEHKDCDGARRWATEHEIYPDSAHYFESRAVHQLCAQAMKPTSSNECRSFAERVSETELRVFLAHSLQRAGFADCDVDTIISNRG